MGSHWFGVFDAPCVSSSLPPSMSRPSLLVCLPRPPACHCCCRCFSPRRGIVSYCTTLLACRRAWQLVRGTGEETAKMSRDERLAKKVCSTIPSW